MKNKGFTLIELMVAITILGLIMAAIVVVLVNSQKAKRKSEQAMEAQNMGRAAMEVVLRDVKTAGYGIPILAGIPSYEYIVYATPYECIFNTNLNPFPDDPAAPGVPRSYDPTVNPQCPHYTALTATHGTGTETYRYTLDSDGDGSVTTADNQDDALETGTRNPNDYLLVRQTYGQMDDGTNNAYPILSQPVALVRGPASSTDNSVVPIFQYWYRNGAGDLVLVGDGNGDGVLTGNERLFANPQADTLNAIEEIVITITTEPRSPIDNRDLYPQFVVSTRTNLANVPIQTANRHILGEYLDESSNPINGGQVFLSTFQTTTTASDGSYGFRVEDGSYTVTPQKLIHSGSTYFVLFHPQDTVVTVAGGDVNNVNFIFKNISETDICRFIGKVYYDTIPPIGMPAVPDPLERGISGVRINISGTPDIATSTNLSFDVFTDANGEYSIYVPKGKYVVTEADSAGYSSSTPNIRADTLDPVADVDTVNFGDITKPLAYIKVLVWKDADKDTIQDATEPLLPNVLCRAFKSSDLSVTLAEGRTDNNGIVILAVDPDTICAVMEYDPDTMTSTCAVRLGLASAPDSVVYPLLNFIDNISVPEDSTYRVKFGDVPGFVTIALGQTERVLSLVTPNFNEKYDPPGDFKNPVSQNDNDIALGTVKSLGTSNLLIWYNRYQNSTTPLNTLFPSNPDFNFDLGWSIPALTYGTYNTGSTDDLVAGLVKNTIANNFRVGMTNEGSGPKWTDKGKAWATVTNYATHSTLVANTDVYCAAAGYLTNSTRLDLAIGTVTGINTGTVEIWKSNSVAGALVWDQTIDKADGASEALGEVRALCVADVVDSTGTKGSDGLEDIIIGTKTADWDVYTGQLVIYRRSGYNGSFVFHRRYGLTDCYVNTIAAYVSGKPANTKLDLAIGLRTIGSEAEDHMGALEIWHNNNDGTFGPSGTPPNQLIILPGEPLSLATGLINIDGYYDVVAGIKTGIGDNKGKTLVFYTSPPGYLQAIGNDPSGGAFTGEAVAVKTSVLRPSPGKIDIVVGERYESGGHNYGRVIIYFNSN